MVTKVCYSRLHLLRPPETGSGQDPINKSPDFNQLPSQSAENIIGGVNAELLKETDTGLILDNLTTQ